MTSSLPTNDGPELRWPTARCLILGLFLALVVAPAAAQSPLTDEAFGGADEFDANSAGLTRGSFILAPIPIRNPTIGTGLALGAGYLFTIDPGSDPSFIGLGALKTDNGSQGAVVGANLKFGGGRWNLRGAFGQADLSYDLFVLGVPLPIGQTGDLARLGISYGVTKTVSAGLDFGYIESEIRPEIGALPASVSPDFGISTGTADLVLGFDTRDDTIYPTSGVNATFRAGWGTVVDGPERDFERALAKLAFYVPAFGSSVIAGQAAACRVADETPFFLSCSLGGSDAFRGYSSTENLGDSLASLQLALRGHLVWRFGYAVFAGVGSVGDDFSALDDAGALAAGGLGLRFRLSRKFPVDFSVDVAVNREEETTTYIYVGQRF